MSFLPISAILRIEQTDNNDVKFVLFYLDFVKSFAKYSDYRTL